MKLLLLSTLAVLISLTSFAQKPKKTHDSEKFAQLVYFSMTSELIGRCLPNDAALQYVADNSGKKLGELREESKMNTENLKKDADQLTSKGLVYILDKTEVIVKQESPFIIADIVMHCHVKENTFTVTLSNCFQTNISWYLGDAITPEGAGFESAVTTKEARDNKEPGKFISTIEKGKELEEKIYAEGVKSDKRADSLRQARPGYEAQYSTYFNEDLAELPLEGYYIKNNGEKVNAVIAFLRPQFLTGVFNSLYICKEANGKKVDYLNSNLESNFKEFIKHADIKAFFVADQLYTKNIHGDFCILISEGAIHAYTEVMLYNKEKQIFKVYAVTQKLNGEKYGSFFLGITDNQRLSFMLDAPEIVEGYKNGEYNIEEAEIKYNIWYEENNPGKINYIFGKDYGVTVKETPPAPPVVTQETIDYNNALIDKYDHADKVPVQDYFAGRPLDPSKEVASAKPEVTLKKETFVDRLNRIKADGNKVGVLIRCNNIYVNPGSIGGENKMKVVGSYGPLKGIEKVALNVTETLNSGFGVDVFETVDYSLIPVKDGATGKMDDWWSTKYKMIVIYDITPAYAAINNGSSDFIAYMTVSSEMLLLAAEDNQQTRLKYVTPFASKWGEYKSESYRKAAYTDFDIIQDLKAVINPPSDDVVIEALLTSQKGPIEEFIKKKLK